MAPLMARVTKNASPINVDEDYGARPSGQGSTRRSVITAELMGLVPPDALSAP